MKSFLLLNLFALPALSTMEGMKFRVDYGNNLAAPPPSKSSDSSSTAPTDKDGKPISPVKAAFIERMEAARAEPQPHWSDEYNSVCDATSKFSAEIYPIESLDPDKMDAGVAWAAKKIDTFFTGPYPGGFTAEEKGMRLVRMDWKEMSSKVRKWVEGNATQRNFLVVDGVCFFAPGTVLAFMPLFVEGEGSCGSAFEDLERYGKDVGGERYIGSIMGKVETGNSVTLQLRMEKLVRKNSKVNDRGKDEL